MSKLIDKTIKNAKAKDKAYTLSDGQGLSLHITPKNQKWWRFRYQFDGKAKMISLGTYPEISLAKARKYLSEAREKVATGIDPSSERKAKKEANLDNQGKSYQTRH